MLPHTDIGKQNPVKKQKRCIRVYIEHITHIRLGDVEVDEDQNRGSQ
jgi:hypothetical protein